MNTYKKYCPNVFVAQCEQEYKKGDVITLTTKYGKENDHVVHNFLGFTGTKENPIYCYSITRLDGYDCQERAKNKAERLSGYAENAEARSRTLQEASNEGKDFLSLGEPIKIGHHSEKRHRALIERNWNRMDKAMKELDKAKSYENRIEYWESMANKINLSMPESMEFFAAQFEEAKEHHQFLKDNPDKRSHSFALTYAKKRANDLQKKCDIAQKLWA